MFTKNSSRDTTRRMLIISIALVWLINGLLCKVLDLVPRHEQIVARILGDEYAGFITKAIGVSEILMAIWILSGARSRLCTLVQIVVVTTMNIIEFLLAPDLLLFGRVNLLFATILIIFIWITEFVLRKKPQKKPAM